MKNVKISSVVSDTTIHMHSGTTCVSFSVWYCSFEIFGYKKNKHQVILPHFLNHVQSQGFHSSSMGIGVSNGYSGMVGKPNEQPKVEAKYPALLFKQHLTACVEKIYGMIRDCLKKEISSFLNLCIQVSNS